MPVITTIIVALFRHILEVNFKEVNLIPDSCIDIHITEWRYKLGMPVDLDVVRSRVSDIKASIQELYRLTSKRYNELSIDEKYSIRYNIIVLVEALVALCSHIAVEELGKIPRSYRESVRTVAEYLNIPCIDDLEALVGLRNLLIHRYQIILDDKVYSFIKEDFKCLHRLVKEVMERYQ